MNSNYQLADLISFINVGSSQHLTHLKFKNSSSNLNIKILALLERQGIIRYFRVDPDGLDIYFRYKQSMPVFSSLKVVSTPGKRVFKSFNKLKLASNHFSFSGFYILSTSKGLMTSNEALLLKKASGEILVKVEI
jgi:ribosomal protein S8